MLRKSFNATAAAAAIALSLTACGGGGGGTPALPSTGAPTSSTPTQGQVANASMTIKIPARPVSSSSRAQYISASTQSMTIGIVSNSKTTQIAEVDLTATSKSCSALAGGGLQCNVVFVGTAGPNTYALSMYDKTGGTGNMLSSGQVAATLVAGQNTNIPIALDGVPVAVSAALGTTGLPVGQAGSTNVVVEARDSDKNIIVGPGGFSTAVTLAISNDAHNTLTMSTTASGTSTAQSGTTVTVNSPAQLVTLNYNGGSNVGATITPSIGNTKGTAATFNATGATLTEFQYVDTTNSLYLEPYDVGVNPTNGNAAIEGYMYTLGCCGSWDAIASAVPTGSVSKVFTGDTSDPYNVPAAGSVTQPGMTVVNGMSSSLNYDEFDAYDDVAVGSDGTIYYSGSFSTSSAPNCSGAEYSGTVGALNPTAGTTTEKILKGYPGPIHVDSKGNVWWIEYSGQCNGSYLFPSDSYAVGEWNRTSGTITETPFSAAGLSTVGYPADMSITPDGSQMFILDNSNEQVVKIATTFGAPATVPLHNSRDGYAIATGDDGTTAWWSDNDPLNNYFYGYVPGTKAFSQTNMSEAQFPVNAFYSESMAYADGSFWMGGDEYYTGIGRLSGLSAGAPIAGYYPSPIPDDDYQYIYGIGAGGGYVWAADEYRSNIDIMTYGAPNSGMMSFNARHQIGTRMSLTHHAANQAHRAPFKGRHSMRKHR